MLKYVRKQLFGSLVIFTIIAFCSIAVADKSIKIVGTINEDGVFVDQNGTFYLLAEDEKSEELTENSGKKVEVKGSVEENSDGNKTISIESYKILAE